MGKVSSARRGRRIGIKGGGEEEMGEVVRRGDSGI